MLTQVICKIIYLVNVLNVISGGCINSNIFVDKILIFKYFQKIFGIHIKDVYNNLLDVFKMGGQNLSAARTRSIMKKI